MVRMSGRNFVIELFLVHTMHEAKFSEMTIALQGRLMGPYPFGCFLVSPGPTYGRNIKSKAVNHFGRFPRKLYFGTAVSKIEYCNPAGHPEPNRTGAWVPGKISRVGSGTG